MTDPTPYAGVLVRSSLQDQGTVPRNGAYGWTASPDIILAGTQLPNDPQATYATAAVYGQDFGGVITTNNANYIYIRGKNLTSADMTVGAYLFYSPSNLVLNPQQWTMPQYQISGAGQSPDSNNQNMYDPQPITVAANQIAVNGNPFVWLNPPSPPPGQHFCLIAMVGTQQQVNDQYAAACAINTWADLGAWVLDYGGVGWRNVVETDAGAADFSVETAWTNPGGSSNVQLQLDCVNLPCGSQVAFSMTVPDANGTVIQLAKTTVPTPSNLNPGDPNPGFSVGPNVASIPQGYTSPVFYQWYGNGYAKPEGFSLTLKATVLSNGKDKLADHPKAQPLAALMIADDLLIDHPEHGLMPAVEALESMTLRFGPNPPVDVNAAVIGTHSAMRLS